jgi:hypothetical protein
MKFDAEREERLKIDEELHKYHKQLTMLKQEEILKKKKYQDNLLSQINEKIQKQMQFLNNKYNDFGIDNINQFK